MKKFTFHFHTWTEEITANEFTDYLSEKLKEKLQIDLDITEINYNFSFSFPEEMEEKVLTEIKALVFYNIFKNSIKIEKI